MNTMRMRNVASIADPRATDRAPTVRSRNTSMAVGPENAFTAARQELDRAQTARMASMKSEVAARVT